MAEWQDDYLTHCAAEWTEIRNSSQHKGAYERVRALVEAMSSPLSSARPDYAMWLDACLPTGDMQQLNNLIYQHTRIQLMPGTSGGYDHCFHAFRALNALACGDWDAAERILRPCEVVWARDAAGVEKKAGISLTGHRASEFAIPQPDEAGLVSVVFHDDYCLLPPQVRKAQNGYAFLVVLSNLLDALWLKDDALLPHALAAAQKFMQSKKPANERAVIAFLWHVHAGDTQVASEQLQKFCEGYGRTDISPAEKRLCVPAHGLYSLAEMLLPSEQFARIQMPAYKNFNRDFAEWRIANKRPQAVLFVAHPVHLDIFNRIYLAPAPRSMVSQCYLYSDNPYLQHAKKEWTQDEEIMLREFVKGIPNINSL